MKFRNDINGLRAIAVIAVVLFHFQPSWLPNGYVGVDVFFVISGYLMTGIIFSSIEKQQFNLLAFYVSRANRIIPALALLCSVLLIYGWFALTPVDYKLLGKHVFSSISFISNHTYWGESGYFETASHEKWLLHTWSLSVEWQFYLIYPLALLICSKFLSLINLKRLILVGSIVGFLFSAWASLKWANASYYLLPTRAWEMLIGGLAFVYPLKWSLQRRKTIELVGLTLIFSSLFVIPDSAAWPGYWALLPTLGTYLVIGANIQQSAITNNRVSALVGKWSYSIYLWHWPIVVFGNYQYENWFVFGIPLSLLCGAASYSLIERRNFLKVTHLKELFSSKPIYYAATVFCCGYLVSLNGASLGIRPASQSEQAQYLAIYERGIYNVSSEFQQRYRQNCNYYWQKKTHNLDKIDDSCTEGIGGTGILLWGDSHAQALSFGLRQAFPNDQILQVATSSCQPSLEQSRLKENRYSVACDAGNQKARDTLVKINPSILLLAQRDKHDANAFYDQVIEFVREKNLDTKVVIIGPVPQWQPSLPHILARRHFSPEKQIIDDVTFQSHLVALDQKMNSKYTDSQATYISLLDQLCSEEGCIAKVDDKNTPLLFDNGHLTAEGSEFVVERVIKDRLKPLL